MGNPHRRLSGSHKVSVEERRRLVAGATGIPVEEIDSALAAGGLDAETADKFVENVLGVYALPFGVALNVTVNGIDHVVPMVVEEPSVIAAASGAAKLVRAHGGFVAEVDPPIMTCQVQLYDVPDGDAGRDAILGERDELLAMANRAVSGLVGRGGGAKDLEVRFIGVAADAKAASPGLPMPTLPPTWRPGPLDFPDPPLGPPKGQLADPDLRLR